VSGRGAVWGILLAGGSGHRFGGRKQFTPLSDGERLVDVALRCLAGTCDGVVIVLPPGVEWDGRPVQRTAVGGAARAESVRAGLEAVPEAAETIVVHQAAHPLASAELCRSVLRAVADGASAAVPGLRPNDVVRRVRAGLLVEDMGRDDLAVIQTPGAFRADILRAAYAGADAEAHTDESGLLMACGITVSLVEGEPANVHVATPTELAIARALYLEAGAR
jgi:2-C-methyl-D-erythritol 4-phosphate cytidylyltransferase